MSTENPTIGILAERAGNLDDFDRDEVRLHIERFTPLELEALNLRRDLVGTLIQQVRDLWEEVSRELVDRREAIEMALASFMAHVNMVFLGPPGTAKSLVVRRLSYGLGLQSQPTTIAALTEEIKRLLASDEKESPGRGQTRGESDAARADQARRYYEVLLTRYSTSDEILGPANLQLMIRRAMFYRQTTGLLPEAEVAFLDEIWKANSAILNALLSISNERLFYNAGKPLRVPLCMIFGASNEVPREEELWAMYDRFPIRVICQPVENSRELLARSAELAYRALFGSDDGQAGAKPTQRRATVNHFRLLHRALFGYFGPESRPDGNGEFSRAFCDTFDCLKREFQISDRSLPSLYRVALALALLHGHDSPQPTELKVFKYSFYEQETAPALRDAVDQRIRHYGHEKFSPTGGSATRSRIAST
jgi:MoxR-like ATPase